MGKIVYHESFDNGPGKGWTVGKNTNESAGDDIWHRNILGHWGKGCPLGWEKAGGISGGYVFSESPWYFDDNHGEFMWFHLVFRIKQFKDIGLNGTDLRDATVNFGIRGQNMKLNGTKIYFWIQGYGGSNRATYTKEVLYNWALTSQPIKDELEDGGWHNINLKLYNDEDKWSQLGLIKGGLKKKIRVIQSRTAGDGTLDGILGGNNWNGGLLLCGVDPLEMPEGRLDLDEFKIIQN